MRFPLFPALLLLFGSFGGSTVHAQTHLKASEKATVSQTVDGTTIAVEYSRPSARGRELFGALVPWDVVWTPGANWATTLELSRGATVAGQKAAAGRYSVWTLPGAEEWTVMLHEDADRFHLRKVKPEECRYRFTVKPQRADHYAEHLTFSFTGIDAKGATLNLHWGSTVVPIRIEAERSFAVPKVSEADAAALSGLWVFQVRGVVPEPIEMNLKIIEVEGELRGYLGAKESLQFIPTDRANEFLLADLRAGEIVSVQDSPAVFRFSDGRATGFELEADGGVRLTGERRD